MTKGAETVFPSGAHEFITDFSGILAFVNMFLLSVLWMIVCPFVLVSVERCIIIP
jgi:hypothetical protein